MSNPTPEQVAAAKAEADKIAAETDAKAVVTFREYQHLKSTNPFAAARMRQDASAAIERGRDLATQPEPPNAA